MRAAFFVVTLALVAAACHEDPNSGLPSAGVRLPWHTYEQCSRRIETYELGATLPRPYRVLSRTSVTCTPYVPNECDDALRARACDLGGDAVLIAGIDQNSTPRTPWEPTRKSVAQKMRSAIIVAWEKASSADAGASATISSNAAEH